MEFLGLKNFLEVAPNECPVGKQLRRVWVDGAIDLLMKPSDACAGELWCFPLVLFTGAGRGIPQINTEELHGVVEGHLLIRWEPEVCRIGGPCDYEGMSLTVP